MTVKGRVKICLNCGSEILEGKRESNSQWERRSFCSMKCNNSSEKRVANIFDRLNRYQVKGGGCWQWSGAKDSEGYGLLSNRKGAGFSPEKAHRVSYEKANGKIDLGLNVCHKCDNPECTNPDHLFLGTQKENMKDCSVKGRLNPKSLQNLIAGKAGFSGAGVDKNKVE